MDLEASFPWRAGAAAPERRPECCSSRIFSCNRTCGASSASRILGRWIIWCSLINRSTAAARGCKLFQVPFPTKGGRRRLSALPRPIQSLGFCPACRWLRFQTLAGVPSPPTHPFSSRPNKHRSFGCRRHMFSCSARPFFAAWFARKPSFSERVISQA